MVPAGAWAPAATSRQPLDLALQQERDDERVDDQRLDQREAEDERGEDLVRRAWVASDAVERSRGRAALTERAAERRQADREARRQGDPTALAGLDLGDLLGVALGERDRRG